MKKRADGRYLKQITIGRQPDGSPKYKNIFGRTQREVEKKAADFIALQNKGLVSRDEKLTVDSWAQTWLETYKSGVRPPTYTMYKYIISKHFAPFAGIRLTQLRSADIQAALNSLRGHRRTQEKFLLTIKQVLRQAVINDFIYKNVAEGIKLPPCHKKEKRALTDKEQQDIFALALPEKTRAYLGLIMYCGLRRGEAWALNTKDISLKNRTVHVSKTTYYDHGIKVGPPKTQAAVRTIPMPDELFDILSPYLKKRSSLFVFGENGQFMREAEFDKMWRGFISAYNESKGGNELITAIAGDITPHIFRHTYATMLYYAGVELKEAQYLLGHSTIAMTLNIYTHLDNRSMHEAGGKLNEFLKQKSVKNQSVAKFER